ncbi:MAG: hypothetical protein EHM65_11075 [Acidobacteriales bacterium]|nr:MAG: hypothetical protein EHM65_11075 [Terriglobales bacterium]
MVWLLVFALLGACLVPVAFMIGGFTSATEFAIRTVSPFICPEDSTGTVYSYSTTSYNDNGVAVPATAYELHCFDPAGGIVKEDPILFAFIWEGIAAAAALVIMAVLAFALAAPAAVLANKLFNSRAKSRR